jgi:serine/threonine protein kinase/predicted transcriptional regulator
VRERLPDQEPYRAWTNLEFLAEDGTIHEVDLLVLTPKGLFLVEIKSWPGTLEGDASTWTLRGDGTVRTFDSPLLLANRKARKLASLLKRQKGARGAQLPYLKPLVFLSHPSLQLKLAGAARQGVHLRDREASSSGEVTTPARPGIVAALTRFDPSPAFQAGRVRVYPPVGRAVARSLEEAGIRPSQRARRVGDYQLDELLFTGPTYQDWLAHHATAKKTRRRIRLYPLPAAAGAEARAALERAARREMEALETVPDHPGLLKPQHLTRNEVGPALVFEHAPDALRLDHYLTRDGARLDLASRLALVRQLAETLQYVHEHRVFHRALSPQSVLVWDPGAERPKLKICNWQTALHESSATGTTAGLAGTTHLDPLLEDAALVYLAPEAITLADALPEPLDVFSLGALAYLIFSGQPPAGSVVELHDRLREGQGLLLSAALDGADSNLQSVIQLATHPVVASRIPSVSDFLGYLDLYEEERAKLEVTELEIEDPVEGQIGDLLPGGYRVVRRLSKSSTAVVFLVSTAAGEQVLKLAVKPEADERLKAEGEVLRRLDHPRFVRLLGEVTVGERAGLLLPYAAEGTLAHRLRLEGRLQLELLQRWGEDLLQAVDYLERTGESHRDLKPDNLGIAKSGRNDELHLVLFDFSLARTPAENLFAGTRPYLDPFLRHRRPRRWDLQAERYAAAVTLYEMATGTLPRWGDGHSDPAMLDEEAHLDAELLDAAMRDPLAAFFRQALRRHPSQRFDNAQLMLAAWRHAFAHTDRPATSVTTEEQPDELRRAVRSATLETSVSLLHLSTRAVNALDRAQVLTVGDLLRLPVSRISHMRGVGSKTRKELLEAIRLLADAPGLSAALSSADAAGEPALPTPDETDLRSAVFSLDLLLREILPRGSKAVGERRILQALCGLGGPAAIDELEGPEGKDAPAPSPLSRWPSQSEVAEALGITRARVSQVLVSARRRWARNAGISRLRDDVARLLAEQGGAATDRELAAALLALRGSAQEEPLRSRHAAAALRAADETEESAAAGPRWRLRRSAPRAPGEDERVAFALAAPDAGDGPNAGEALLDYVDALGRRADLLAAQDPLPSPQRALEALQGVPRAVPSGILSPERLLRLATAASAIAALSSRLEIYPRHLAPERALRLASGTLLGGRELTVADVHARVKSRYPEAQDLPLRTRLDDLVREVGLDWAPAARDGQGAYCFREAGDLTLSSSTTLRGRTTLSPPEAGFELSAEAVDERLFEDRLRRADREGAFLALLVAEKSLIAAEEKLARRFPVERISLEALWIEAMRELAAANGVDWEVVLRSDAQPAGHPDAQNLSRFVVRALETVEARLAASPRTLLLTRPGLLARYGQMGFLERLRERVTHRPAPGTRGLHGVWLVLASDGSSPGPQVDGAAVSVLTPGQWAEIPPAWLRAAADSSKEPA